MHDTTGHDHGHVTLTGLSGRVYTAHFGTNAMCRLEAIAGRPYHEVLLELHGGMPRMETARQLVQAVLTDPATPDADTAGAVLDDLGGIPVLLLAIGTKSQPEA